MENEYINPKDLADDFNAPKLIVHESCESIFHKHWNFENDLTLEELLNCETGSDDDEETGTLRDVFEATKANGFWAYSAEKENEIHIWVGTLTDFESLLLLLGHEIGHLIEAANEQSEGKGEELYEELQADGYGIAAVWAYRFAQQLTESKP